VIERIRNEVLHRLDPAKEAADRAFLRQYMLAYELVQGDLAGDRLPCSMVRGARAPPVWTAMRGRR